MDEHPTPTTPSTPSAPSAPWGANGPRLAVYVSGVTAGETSEAWLAPLRDAGVALFSHAALEGARVTSATRSRLGAVCREVMEQAPGLPLLLLEAPLEPSRDALEALTDLAGHAHGVAAFTTFTNAEAALNPFAGLDTGATDRKQRERLVSLLGEGQLRPLPRWPKHLLLLTANAVEALADPDLTWEAAPARLRSLQGKTALADWIWSEDPSRPVNLDEALEPHEIRRPRPWGAVSERLQAWLEAGQKHPGLLADLPGLTPEARPVTLHVTHSWGGGVATWVESFIEAETANTPDGEALHLQLRSEGPQAGAGAGQRLSLYLGNRLEAPLASWWLQPPIEAVATTHGPYREVLDLVGRRFGVGRVIVSSLVGHSLDALRTELPTVQVLHDAFPAWPLLSIHPQEYGGDLERALADPRSGEQFRDVTAEDWRRLGEQYAEAAAAVIRVAPSEAAREVQAMVDPGLEPSTVTIIPHGLPTLAHHPVTPRERPDGKLRVVIPGRVQSGKGAALLEAALPGLLEVAQVTLLGTGKGGERFFGQGGVNVILQYERQELGALLDELSPHLALLPSTVPETFSYTLSEMHAFAIPVLATALGSFPERIEPGVTGWCEAPEADALVDRVRQLADDRRALDAVREHLAARTPASLDDMASAYGALCAAERRTPQRPVRPTARLDLAEAQAASGLDELQRLRGRLEESRGEVTALAQLVEERTRWARDEEKTRIREVKRLQAEQVAAQKAHQQEHDRQQEALAERARHIEHLDRALAEERERGARRVAEVQAQLDQVVNSHSWKLTLPLRVSRRVLANARQQRVWNPLRWPLLLSQTARNLSTVGVSGTLRRMQHFGTESPAPRSELAVTAAEPARTAVLPKALPVSDQPRVSIIVPVFNHLDHTTVCLASLAEVPSEIPFEVIVVDDESSDETGERLPGIEGLTYLRNEENQGFIRSCNRGAAAARGAYVLFLNNDTQVREGWLDALVHTLESEPDAGLVGARLVYPDGTLQECGGMIFSDGSGWNYGRGDDPDRPEYQAVREVDYCSGACILLRRDLWESLEGFDERYLPAYYEDTDLAFRVRERGLKVYVQPRATIIHFEGVSSGTDLSSGTKRFQAVNRRKFLERWAGALERQPRPIENPQDLAAVRRARDHRLLGRVLVVDAYTPEPDQDSGSVRLVNFMRCLRRLGYGVSFFADNRAWNGDYTRALQDQGVEAWYDPWLVSREAFLAERGAEFSHVMVSRHYVACHYLAPVRKYAPQAKFLFDTVDLHFLREERLAELEDSATLRQVAKQTRRSELAVIRAADATLVVSPVERELLAEAAPAARVFILSNIHEVAASGRPFGDRKDVYFVGGYQHPPNIDAARWFVESIWPDIRHRLPGVTFHLVGSKAPDEVSALGDVEGVHFHGFVETLDPFLDGCRLAVAPLRYGAGVKGKVNQAMAHGQPVVATPAAVEGIHATDGEDVLVAGEAGDFADAVVRLYQDEALWERLSEGGRGNVERHFSIAAAERDIGKLFAALDAGGAPRQSA
ncbi:MAG: glycosyltransferase [Xanthomonadales bacterium]|jgi:GT2 family glycosyltransferase|nr:glycosyltransferase [Xanthomonadales bacterium]